MAIHIVFHPETKLRHWSPIITCLMSNIRISFLILRWIDLAPSASGMKPKGWNHSQRNNENQQNSWDPHNASSVHFLPSLSIYISLSMVSLTAKRLHSNDVLSNGLGQHHDLLQRLDDVLQEAHADGKRHEAYPQPGHEEGDRPAQEDEDEEP